MMFRKATVKTDFACLRGEILSLYPTESFHWVARIELLDKTLSLRILNPVLFIKSIFLTAMFVVKGIGSQITYKAECDVPLWNNHAKRSIELPQQVRKSHEDKLRFQS